MKCHVFFTALDDLYNSLENRCNQETLNVINAIVSLIELKTEEFEVELLSPKFLLNSVVTIRR